MPPKVVENLPSGNLFVVYSCSGFALDFNNDCPNPKAPATPATAAIFLPETNPPVALSISFKDSVAAIPAGLLVAFDIVSFVAFTAFLPTCVAVAPAPTTASGVFIILFNDFFNFFFFIFG